MRVCLCDAASGIGSLVQPMVWYYQTTFSLPAGLYCIAVFLALSLGNLIMIS